MPRIPISLLNTARSSHPYLPILLRVCRDLCSAQNELRWLREHEALRKASDSKHRQSYLRGLACRNSGIKRVSHPSCWTRRRKSPRLSREKDTLYKWCRERSRGVPLQYILGSQPFGAVDVLCRRGVLIPRCVSQRFVKQVRLVTVSWSVYGS